MYYNERLIQMKKVINLLAVLSICSVFILPLQVVAAPAGQNNADCIMEVVPEEYIDLLPSRRWIPRMLFLLMQV